MYKYFILPVIFIFVLALISLFSEKNAKSINILAIAPDTNKLQLIAFASTPSATPTPILLPSPCGTYGDVNLDGGVSTPDATLIANYLVGNASLSAQQKLNADVKGIGQVVISDALLIAQYAAGNRSTFPVCK